MMIKRLCGSAALLSAGASLFATPTAKNEGRPNIVLFLVDDMGWQDTSLPFWKETTPLNRLYETPNMERLAQRGVKFTSAYACSVSSPTRVSLFTGMNAARHRVTNWTLQKNQSTDAKDDLLEYPQWNVNGFSPEAGVENTCYAKPLSQLLHDNGYYTIHCGKAHFGAIGTPAANPSEIGFDVNIAGHAGGGLASYLGEQNYGNRKDGKPSSPFAVPGLDKYHGTDVFVTEALTREAISALNDRNKQKPFFLYMAHYAVHIPLDIDKRYHQKYLDKGMDSKEAAYAGLIEGMDKSLGDLMDYLDKNNLTENTVVMFMSDNGGLSAAGTGRGATPDKHNLPLNSGKGSAYEGGVREPMIVSWPGKAKPGTSCDDYLIIEDYFPTILEIAGVKNPQLPQVVDGKSFLSLIKGKGVSSKEKRSKKEARKMANADARSIYWNFPNKWGASGAGIGATATVRKGDWKLIYYYKSGKKELFNIREDIGEQHDVAGTQGALVQKLSADLGEYLRASGAQRPVFKATGKPAPWPDEV